MAADVDLAEFIEWDVRNWSAALNYWKGHSTQDLSQCSVLEVGCGYGGISLWFALQGARVTCTDVNGPQDRVVRKHESYRVSHPIKYEPLNATDIPYENNFDIVVFKSMLGAIDKRELQARAISQMHKALKAGGELFFAENLTASGMHGFLRRKFVKWGELWRYVSPEEMNEFLSPFSIVNTLAVGFAGTFGRSEKQRTALGALDQLAFNRIVPEKWKYILLGVARK